MKCRSHGLNFWSLPHSSYKKVKEYGTLSQSTCPRGGQNMGVWSMTLRCMEYAVKKIITAPKNLQAVVPVWLHLATLPNRSPSVNIGFPNGPVFRYGNFFIPRVEKSSQISPRAKNLVLPRAVGPREARFFSQGLIFEDFLTRGMKKFSYLTTTAHSEIVFL